MMRSTMLAFTGRLQPQSFAAFMEERARLLDLRMRLHRSGPERMEVALAGDDAVIGMFEMACSLGPIDCLVLDVAELDGAEARESRIELRKEGR